LLQLPIDTRMIAPEGAHANDRNIDREFLAQAKAPQRRSIALLSQFQPPMGKCETRNPRVRRLQRSEVRLQR
jgi:hypothetical protein